VGWKLGTLKQGHERTGKELEPLVECFQGPFATDGIPEEDGEKIDDLITPETPPRKAHTLIDLRQDIVLAQIPGEQRDARQTRKASRGQTRKRSGYSAIHRRYWS
jgi:hypothetical protein